MPFDTAVTAIEDRANSLWPALESAVPLALENGNFDPAISAVATDGSPLAWLMVRVEWSGGDFITIGSPGSNVARRDGNIWAYAFIPQGAGASRAHHLIAEAASMFEGQDFSGIICEAAMPGGPVSSENGNFFGQSVAIPFYFDETA